MMQPCCMHSYLMSAPDIFLGIVADEENIAWFIPQAGGSRQKNGGIRLAGSKLFGDKDAGSQSIKAQSVYLANLTGCSAIGNNSKGQARFFQRCEQVLRLLLQAYVVDKLMLVGLKQLVYTIL